MKALVGAFNQEEALLGAFCVIVKLQSSRRFVSSSSSQSGVVMEKWATLSHWLLLPACPTPPPLSGRVSCLVCICDLAEEEPSSCLQNSNVPCTCHVSRVPATAGSYLAPTTDTALRLGSKHLLVMVKFNKKVKSGFALILIWYWRRRQQARISAIQTQNH